MYDTAAFAPAPISVSSVLELLSDPLLHSLRRSVAARTTIIEPQQPSTNLYFIESGQVRVYQVGPDSTGRLLEILGPNDWFGVAALAQQPTYGSRAVAVAQSVIWEVPAQRLLAVLPTRPLAAMDLVRQLAVKFQNAIAESGELIFDDCNHRLLKTLVRFSGSSAASAHDDGVVLRITHHQLAQAVGVARETVSLALTQLRRQKLLRTGRNQLFFNPAALRSFAENHNGKVLEHSS